MSGTAWLPQGEGNRFSGLITAARASIITERDALDRLAQGLDEPELMDAFAAAVSLIERTRGRVIVTGVGKSGIIARKIAATLSSTGTPALFLHAGDASHGDLGMVMPSDVMLALSWSGESDELPNVFSYCRRIGVPVMVITANATSRAAEAADVCLTLPKVTEACPNRLAPTSSAIVQLALGDALAVALLDRGGFSRGDFRALHPSGLLGGQLRPLADVMTTGEAVPRVVETATVLEAAVEMTRKRFGCTAVVNAEGRLVGAFTDGDLRRSLLHGGPNDPISRHMTGQPQVASDDMLASQALGLLAERRISVLYVVRGEELAGIIHLQDLLSAGVMPE